MYDLLISACWKQRSGVCHDTKLNPKNIETIITGGTFLIPHLLIIVIDMTNCMPVIAERLTHA